jgi:hypothetical protein
MRTSGSSVGSHIISLITQSFSSSMSVPSPGATPAPNHNSPLGSLLSVVV